MNKPNQNDRLQVTASINDFSPLLRGAEFLFRGLQTTGVDGVELCVGVKSRWTIGHYQRLAEQYKLPIVSLHQPPWAVTGIYFDENFFILGQKLNVQHITCHPLPGVSLQDRRMRAYFKKLAVMQERSGIPVLVENLPQAYRSRLLHHFFPPASDTGNMLAVCKAAKEFGLGVTLDTDHVHLPEPHREAWFEAVLPHVGNIHLSSFGAGRRHLPLYMGDLQTVDLLTQLRQYAYTGTLTLEIAWPKSIRMLNFDFEPIRKSVALLR